MEKRHRIARAWQRYLTWRRGDDVKPPSLPDAPINKVAIDEGDVARIVTANWSGGQGGSA